MNADLRFDTRHHILDDPHQFQGLCAAVRIAEHQGVRAGIFGRQKRSECVIRIRFIAVKEMFGIVNDLFAVLLHMRDGIRDQVHILIQTDLQGLFDVERPGFPEDRHGGRSGIEQSLKVRVFVRREFGASGGTESNQLGMLKMDVPRFFKEKLILRIVSGPSAFDVIDPESIQLIGDPQLVFQREIDLGALGPVPEEGVEDVDFLFIVHKLLRLKILKDLPARPFVALAE